MMFRSILFLIIAIALELFLFFMPEDVMYTDMEWTKWVTMFGVIFLFIPISIYQGLKKLISKSWIVFSIACISPPINGVSFGVYHQNREESKLRSNGIWTTSNVIGRKFRSGKGPDYWMIKAEYFVNSRRYLTSWEQDSQQGNVPGSKIRLIYMEEQPKIYRFEYEWRKDNN